MRSLQVMDDDVDFAIAGDRVGVAQFRTIFLTRVARS